MSWILNPSGDVPRPPGPTEELVEDPTDPSRKVRRKAANQPFLAYKEYRQKQEQEHQAWLLRKKEREEKLSRGEPVGPEERDPTAEEEVGLLGLLKFIVYLLLIIVLAGKFFTGSFLWEYDGKWVRLKTYLPVSDELWFRIRIELDSDVLVTRRWENVQENNGRLFSESYLATFDGRDENKPVYLAIDGDVYDVSSNRRTYGPGGPYRHMAGVDAARSFATGCFATHRTHDLRGLSEEQLQSVRHWKRFFADHKTYFKVGRVLHPPIDPESPIPEPCDPSNAHAQPTEKDLKRGRKVPEPKAFGT
ncbi:cytochrome b5-like heme/steroid binding domain-containing protein [Pisolithus sp. B1]|nr:cytochrome b5-like heme/steroid binding domain-containing protein [Pisolithus sp. B1]